MVWKVCKPKEHSSRGGNAAPAAAGEVPLPQRLLPSDSDSLQHQVQVSRLLQGSQTHKWTENGNLHSVTEAANPSALSRGKPHCSTIAHRTGMALFHPCCIYQCPTSSLTPTPSKRNQSSAPAATGGCSEVQEGSL